MLNIIDGGYVNNYLDRLVHEYLQELNKGYKPTRLKKLRHLYKLLDKHPDSLL